MSNSAGGNEIDAQPWQQQADEAQRCSQSLWLAQCLWRIRRVARSCAARMQWGWARNTFLKKVPWYGSHAAQSANNGKTAWGTTLAHPCVISKGVDETCSAPRPSLNFGGGSYPLRHPLICQLMRKLMRPPCTINALEDDFSEALITPQSLALSPRCRVVLVAVVDQIARHPLSCRHV